MPIGTILPYIGSLSDIPFGWHLCDGTEGTPNLTGRFLQGWGNDGYYNRSIGQYIAEGLPNITGVAAVRPDDYAAQFTSGAFRANVKGYMGTYNDQGTKNNGLSFDASLCSSIYGNSVTVQPRSYIVYYIVKIK